MAENTRNLRHLDDIPIVAIMRGIVPDEAIAMADALYSAGIRVVEVPLNSPISPFVSIERIKKHMGDRMLVGAGTVLSAEYVVRLADVGGEIAVAPNFNPAVVAAALKHGLTPMPGVATASEMFAAHDAGANWLKLFPAGAYGPGLAKALGDVLPASVHLLAVGGVSAADMAEWCAAGVAGFGLGSSLFRPGDSPEKVAAQALEAVNAFKAATKGQ